MNRMESRWCAKITHTMKDLLESGVTTREMSDIYRDICHHIRIESNVAGYVVRTLQPYLEEVFAVEWRLQKNDDTSV